MMVMMMALFCLSKRTPLLTHFFLTHSSKQRRDQALEHFDCQVGSAKPPRPPRPPRPRPPPRPPHLSLPAAAAARRHRPSRREQPGRPERLERRRPELLRRVPGAGGEEQSVWAEGEHVFGQRGEQVFMEGALQQRRGQVEWIAAKRTVAPPVQALRVLGRRTTFSSSSSLGRIRGGTGRLGDSKRARRGQDA